MFTIMSMSGDEEPTQAQKDAIELVTAHVDAARKVGDGRFGPGQGLTLVHFSAQRERFVLDRGCAFV